MLVALAIDSTTLLKVAGPLQVLAMALWVVNLLPLAISLPQPTRETVLVAFTFLVVGLSLGFTLAIDPYYGAIYRQVHALFNLMGWASLLIVGVGYYLVPRFAGNAMAWSRLSRVQVVGIAGGVLIGSALRRLQVTGEGDFETAIWVCHAAIVVSLLSFAVQIGATFYGPQRGQIIPIVANRPVG